MNSQSTGTDRQTETNSARWRADSNKKCTCHGFSSSCSSAGKDERREEENRQVVSRKKCRQPNSTDIKQIFIISKRDAEILSTQHPYRPPIYAVCENFHKLISFSHTYQLKTRRKKNHKRHIYILNISFFQKGVAFREYFLSMWFFLWCHFNMEERVGYLDFVFSPSLWLRFQPALCWSSHCLETLPWDPRCILVKRAPIRNGAHPDWHLAGHGRLACSQVPAAALGACTPGRVSIIHCLQFINNTPLPCGLCCISTSTFLFSPTIFYYVSWRLLYSSLAVCEESFVAWCYAESDWLPQLSLPV